MAIGYVPTALTYGLLAKSAELTFIETMSLSIYVFAGAAQYIALSLITIRTGVFESVLTSSGWAIIISTLIACSSVEMSGRLRQKGEIE